jgi:N-acetylglucosaminyldiphosphoundecaprenol N-acetyl-beta-D-mannosaminyltransferase
MLGLGIDNLSFEEALDRIVALACDPEPDYVVTPNVDHVMRVQRHRRFRRVYHEASLVLADGMPVVWASRILGTPVKAKVSGSDLLPGLAPVAAARGLSLYLLGGQPGAAEACARTLTHRTPSLRIAGVHCPEPGFHLDPRRNQGVLETVRKAAPDILFVALGTPKQEYWIHQYHRELGVPVSIGVGAAFDFLAGAARRAPVWMQKRGLEWLYRLCCEPRRLWKRYLLDDSPFLYLVMRTALRRKREERRPNLMKDAP